MGDMDKLRAAAAATAVKNGGPPPVVKPPVRQVKLEIIDGVVLKNIDLAIHCLAGIAVQLANDWQQVEPAAELQKCVKQLQDYGRRYLSACERRVVLATPAEVPPPPPGLIQR